MLYAIGAGGGQEDAREELSSRPRTAQVFDSAPGYPGQRLMVSMWHTATVAVLTTSSDHGVVLDRGVFEYAARVVAP